MIATHPSTQSFVEEERLNRAFQLTELSTIPDKLEFLQEELDLNDILPGLKLNEPTALLIDVNNFYLRTKENGFALDYAKLVGILKDRCDLRYMAAFSAVDRDDPGALRWITYLRESGFYLFTKDLKKYSTYEGDQVTKGNMDIDITVHAMELSPAFGHVILGTCDGDFIPLVNSLKKGRYRKVSVMGIRNLNHTGMSETLVNTADNFYDLGRFRQHVLYTTEKE